MTKRRTIADLERELYNCKEMYAGIERVTIILKQEKALAEKRTGDIAAENESLRLDKKWLQQIIQRMLEVRIPTSSTREAIR